MELHPGNRHALVTGYSKGIGLACGSGLHGKPRPMVSAPPTPSDR